MLACSPLVCTHFGDSHVACMGYNIRHDKSFHFLQQHYQTSDPSSGVIGVLPAARVTFMPATHSIVAERNNTTSLSLETVTPTRYSSQAANSSVDIVTISVVTSTCKASSLAGISTTTTYQAAPQELWKVIDNSIEIDS